MKLITVSPPPHPPTSNNQHQGKSTTGKLILNINFENLKIITTTVIKLLSLSFLDINVNKIEKLCIIKKAITTNMVKL